MSTTETTDQTEQPQSTCLTKCSRIIEQSLENIFGKLGRIVGNYPWATIILSASLTCAFGAGFMNWTTESRTNKLWIPQNTKAEEHSEWVAQVFGFETRTEEILLRPSDDSNVLSVKYINNYYIAHYLMVNHTSEAKSGYEDEFPGLYSWDGYDGSNSICLRLTSSCDMKTILDIVGYTYENITDLTNEKILELVNDPIVTAGIDLESIIGGLEYDNNGNIISGAVLSGKYSVAAAAIEVDAAIVDPSREQWESEVNEKILNYTFIDTDIVPYFQNAWTEEFGEAIGADGMSYAVGCTLLILYTTVALGKRDYVHSMIGLALCAILTVGLSILGSYGLAGALSIIYSPLSSSLPFLALGLGVDDAFIIVGEFQQQIKDHILRGDNNVNVAKLMEHTMKHAGVSILITSLTDFVAFGIGSTTVLPALQAFCLYASFGVFFVFILNITFFAACVVVDHRRATSNRMDCCCCVKMKQTHNMFPALAARRKSFDNKKISIDDKRASYCYCLHIIPPEASRKMWQWIGEQIVTPFIRNIVIMLAMLMLGFGIYGAHQLEQDFRIEWFIPDTSYLQEYYSWKSAFFDTGTPIFIYSQDINYLQYKEELIQSNYLLRNASYLEHSVYDWHLPFWQYANSYGIVITDDNYYTMLQTYLYGAGGQYNGLIEWNDPTQPESGIAGAFMIGHYQRSAVMNAAKQVDAMYMIRDDMELIMGVSEDENDDIFAFTFQMLFWEQYAVISVEFFRNLALAVCVVFAIALILIPKISAALLVLFTVMCTIVDVMGFMWLWGLTIDAVTVCYTVIAIGLAVDYSAHIGEAYVLSSKSKKEDKVIDSLRRIGASVFNGAFSTFLAVAAMANSQTYIFRVFFKQFFLVTLIGSVHGLIVLPALLSWIGPKGSVLGNETELKGNNTENDVKPVHNLEMSMLNTIEAGKKEDNSNDVDGEDTTDSEQP